MKDTPATTAPASATQPRRRWHWSTWVVAGVVLVVGIVINLGGDDDGFHINHGWPWKFGERFESFDSDDPISILWRVDHIEEWHFQSLVADALLVLVCAVIIAAAWQYRLRRVKHWLQFTIADWMLLCVAVGLVHVGIKYVYSDFLTDQKLRKLLLPITGPIEDDEPPQGDDFACEVTWDWFWESLQVPLHQRPYRRERYELHVSGNNRENENSMAITAPPAIVPLETFATIANFRSLDDCRISFYCDEKYSGPIVIAPESLISLDRLPTQTYLQVFFSGPILNVELLAALGKIRSLDELSIKNDSTFTGRGLSQLRGTAHLHLARTGIDEEGLREINRLPQLKHLCLEDNQTIHIDSWKLLTNVKSLELIRQGITEADLGEIVRLSNLERLDIRADKLSTENWKLLGRMKQLKRLCIHSETFNDQSLAALHDLNRIESLVLHSTAISPAALSSLKKLRSLKSLMIIPIIRVGGNFGFCAISIDPDKGITPEIEKKIVDQITWQPWP